MNEDHKEENKAKSAPHDDILIPEVMDDYPETEKKDSDKTSRTRKSGSRVSRKSDKSDKSEKSDEGTSRPSSQDLFSNLSEIMDKLGVKMFQVPMDGSMAGFGQTASNPKPQKEKDSASGQEETSSPLDAIREFSYTPRQIRDYLDRYVISQDEAKKVLATAICDHYNHVRRCLEDPAFMEKDYAKHNVIMLGPTGVGKTYLMRCIARLIGVPFLKADATKFSETGYVGYDVDDMVRDLVKSADGDVDLAQFGIIYIDEIDKIAGHGGGNGGKDVSGRGVQVNLLKLMEDTDVKLIGQTDMLGQMQAMMAMQSGNPRPTAIRTKFILFIVSGSFENLPKLIQRRLGSSVIGFEHNQVSEELNALSDSAALFHKVQTADLVQFGFEPEFIGRLPVRVALDNLTVKDIEEILCTAENGILEQYCDCFKGYGIDLETEPEAMHLIAEEAAAEKTGARGILTVLERLLREYKFELPGTGIGKLALNSALVTAPRENLQRILQENFQAVQGANMAEVADFCRRFQEAYGLELKFSDAAAAELIRLAGARNKTVRGLCEDLFRNYQHGLTIVGRNNSQSQFLLDLPAVKDPDGYLSDLVRQSFQG